MSINISQSFRRHRSILIILALATLLYLYQLDENSLWIDEFISIYSSQRLPEGLGPVRPLYYILLRFWMVFGTGVWWLRGLSVILGVGSVYLTYRLGERVAGKAVGAAAAVVLACSPLAINHIQEVRMYALGNWLSVAGSLFLLDALASRKAFAIGKWAIARILAVLTIPLSILLLGPDCLLIGWQLRRQRQALGKFLVGLGVVCVALFPSAYDMLFKAGPQYVGSWTAELPKPGLVAVVAKLTSLTAFWPLSSLSSHLAVRGLYYTYTLALAVGMAMALMSLKKRKELWPIALWALLPAAVMLLFSHVFSPIWNGRYLLFLTPYLCILIAAGFSLVWRQRAIAAGLIGLYILAVSGGLHYYYTHWDRDNWKAAVAAIEARVQPDDAIAVSAPLPDPKLAVSYYYQGSAPVYAIDHFVGKIDEATVAQAIESIPTSSDRLWIVFRGFNGASHINRVVTQTVADQYDVQFQESFDGPIYLMLIDK